MWDLHCRTIVDGVREFAHDVIYDDGTDLNRAAAAAMGVDVAVVVVGYSYADEGEFIGATDPSLPAMFPKADEPDVVERFQHALRDLAPITKPDRLQSRPRGFSVGGDRSSLHLPDADVALIRAVAASNPLTVVVIQAGSAVVMTEWIDSVPAVVQAWYGGAEAGPGLADVLFGMVNPSGRLPFSVPVNEADLPTFDRDATAFTYDRWHGWRHLARSGSTPAFAFGFGLSYTSFSIGDVSIRASREAITVHGSVRNTGDRDGADVVQVYAHLPSPDAPPRLVGFARIEVPAGAATAFEIDVPVDRLATRDATRHEWRRATGHHRIIVARCAVDPEAHTFALDL